MSELNAYVSGSYNVKHSCVIFMDRTGQNVLDTLNLIFLLCIQKKPPFVANIFPTLLAICSCILENHTAYTLIAIKCWIFSSAKEKTVSLVIKTAVSLKSIQLVLPNLAVAKQRQIKINCSN